jgi:hypothetical protein
MLNVVVLNVIRLNVFAANQQELLDSSFALTPLSFTSAFQYKKLRKPYIINDLEMQFDIQVKVFFSSALMLRQIKQARLFLESIS